MDQFVSLWQNDFGNGYAMYVDCVFLSIGGWVALSDKPVSTKSTDLSTEKSF